MGVPRFGDQWSGGNYTIFFIYSTQETTIKGKHDDWAYDLKLYKGWNMVYESRNTFLFRERLITTNGKRFPKNKIWYLLKISQ
jgi:hypothetical protein